MPNLTKEFLKFIAEDINSVEKTDLRQEDAKKFFFYNGRTKEIIREAISREFKKKETLEELMARLLPLNSLKKITDKLAMVYLEAPERGTQDGNESDLENLELLEVGMQFNQRMKEANRYFKLFKRNLNEIYVNDWGIPSIRNLPRHTYEVYAVDTKDTHCPNVIVKILKDDADRTKQKFYVVTDYEAKTINGFGELIPDPMNPEGINPYGKLPFIYLNEATYSVDPIGDDDSLGVAIAVPVLLTDLLFACKYQCFSVLYTIGITGDIPFSPNSVIQADYGIDGNKPEIGSIKPTVDSDKILSVIKSILALHLSNKNLSSGTIAADIDVANAASGISKAIDKSESIEDRKDQQEYFQNYEKYIWMFISKYGLPYWKQNQMLTEKYNVLFSDQFDLSIEFKEPKVLLSESEKIDIAKKRHDAGFSTLEEELKFLYPTMSDEEIEAYEDEILAEQGAKLQLIEEPPAKESMNGMESDAED